MINKTRLLNEGNRYFANDEFGKALFSYSQLISSEPTNKEYKLYALFCDIGMENKEKANYLYDYFSIAKSRDYQDAIEVTQKIINSNDKNNDSIIELLGSVSTEITESGDSINYNDFMEVVNLRGSFKIAYEDITYSTKIKIDTKEDFFDFVGKLIDNRFDKVAIAYLDEFNHQFTYDDKIEQYYQKLDKKQNLENNNK